MKTFCTFCRQEYDVEPEWFNRQVNCSACGRNFVVLPAQVCETCGRSDPVGTLKCSGCGKNFSPTAEQGKNGNFFGKVIKWAVLLLILLLAGVIAYGCLTGKEKEKKTELRQAVPPENRENTGGVKQRMEEKIRKIQEQHREQNSQITEMMQ